MCSAAGFGGRVAVFVKGLWLTVVFGCMGEWGGDGLRRMVMVTHGSPDPVPEEPGGAPVPVEEPGEEAPEPEEEAA
jgi:hypothetical protein